MKTGLIILNAYLLCSIFNLCLSFKIKNHYSKKDKEPQYFTSTKLENVITSYQTPVKFSSNNAKINNPLNEISYLKLKNGLNKNNSNRLIEGNEKNFKSDNFSNIIEHDEFRFKSFEENKHLKNNIPVNIYFIPTKISQSTAAPQEIDDTTDLSESASVVNNENNTQLNLSPTQNAIESNSFSPSNTNLVVNNSLSKSSSTELVPNNDAFLEETNASNNTTTKAKNIIEKQEDFELDDRITEVSVQTISKENAEKALYPNREKPYEKKEDSKDPIYNTVKESLKNKFKPIIDGVIEKNQKRSNDKSKGSVHIKDYSGGLHNKIQKVLNKDDEKLKATEQKKKK